MFKKFEKATIIAVAINIGVLGLVLYDTWEMINFDTGKIGPSGQIDI